MKNILLTILVLSTATSKLMAYDASFSHARKFYAKKKYRHAEVLFMRAYKKEGDKRKKAQILRLMSATRYYQGKSKLALASFKLAKKMNPSIKMLSKDKDTFFVLLNVPLLKMLFPILKMEIERSSFKI